MGEAAAVSREPGLGTVVTKGSLVWPDRSKVTFVKIVLSENPRRSVVAAHGAGDGDLGVTFRPPLPPAFLR